MTTIYTILNMSADQTGLKGRGSCAVKTSEHIEVIGTDLPFHELDEMISAVGTYYQELGQSITHCACDRTLFGSIVEQFTNQMYYEG